MGQSETSVEITTEALDELIANCKLVRATLRSDAQLASAGAVRDHMLALVEQTITRLESYR